MTVPTTSQSVLPDGQDLVRRPFRSSLYSGNARAVFDRGLEVPAHAGRQNLERAALCPR